MANVVAGDSNVPEHVVVEPVEARTVYNVLVPGAESPGNGGGQALEPDVIRE